MFEHEKMAADELANSQRCFDAFHADDEFAQAQKECPGCGRFLCWKCIRQGYECVGPCSRVLCRHCEQESKPLHCEDCV